MIRINLIPPELIAAQNRQQQQVLVGSAVGAVVAAFVLFWVLKNNQANSLETQVRDAERELANYRTVNAQIQQIQQEREQLVRKRSVIERVSQDRLIYPQFLEDLLPLIPGDVWFTNMNVDERGAQRNVTVSAQARSNYALANWVENLEQSVHFSNITFSAVSYAQAGGDAAGSVLTFTMTMSHRHVAQAAGRTARAGG